MFFTSSTVMYNHYQGLISEHVIPSIPMSPHFPSSQPLATPNLLFLSLWVYLFWTFHPHGIIPHVAFCVWLSLSMFSKLTHMVACASTSFLGKAVEYSIVWINYILLLIHQLMDLWVTCLFLLFFCYYE